MRIDWWTLALQTINLLVVVGILGHFLFRPLARIIAERQAAARQVLDDAEAERSKAEAAAKAAEDERQAALAARAGILDEARKEAEKQRATLIEGARSDAQKQREEARDAIARMRGEDEERVGRMANRLATDIAAKLLEGPAAHLSLAAFLGGFEAALAGLSPADRDAIGVDGKPLELTFARKPSEADLAAGRETLVRALGREVPVAAQVDPSLIAGLRLATGQAVIDASLRADLDRVLAELDRHGG